MKTRMMVVAALALALAAGCKKKDQDQPGKTAGSAPVARPDEGSAPAPPKPAPKTGRELAQVILDCGARINASRWDEFGAQCLAPSFVAHQADDRDLTRDEVIPKLTDTKVAFPDFRVEPQLVLVNNRTVIEVVLMKGTNDGPLEGEAGTLPPTKKKFGVLVYERFSMNDENKPAEHWATLAPGTMLGQLGHWPKELLPVRPALEQGPVAGGPTIIVASDDDKERANLVTVKKLIDAFNAKKIAEVAALQADDIVEADQALAADVRGKKNVQQVLLGFWKAFPDAQVEMTGAWTAGDYVAMEARFTGTHEGPLGKLPRTGKPVAGQYVEIFKLKDGKIAELWRFRNDAALVKQLATGGPAAGAGPAKGGEPAKGAPTQAPPMQTPPPKMGAEPAPKGAVRAPDPKM